MKRILLDVNVILDILLDRKPHIAASAVVWMAIETGKVQCWVPAHGIITIYDRVQHAQGAAAALARWMQFCTCLTWLEWMVKFSVGQSD